MQRIFHGILSIPQNIVKDLNNVMSVDLVESTFVFRNKCNLIKTMIVRYLDILILLGTTKS